MKTFNTIVKTAALGLAVIVTLVMAAGCFSALTPPVSNSGAIPAGKGALTISIAGADARTIFPDMSGFTYNASFTSGTTVISTGSLVANAANNFYLDPGTWKVDIYATGTIATTPAVLTAVIGAAHIPAIVITAGQTTECTNIQVLPVTQDPSTQATLDNGTLSWSVSFPEDLDTAKLYYGLYGETPTDVDLLQQAATDQSTSLSGSISLVPGTYLVNSHLEKDSLVAGNAEAVHIYAGQTSSINWQYFAASFVDTKSLAGSVNITCSDTIESIQSVVLNIPGVQPISLVKDGSDPAVYSFSDIHIPNSIDTVTGTLTITTDTNIVTVPVSIAYSENLVLDPVHISALEATIGANGSLLIDGVEKTGNYRV
ncbi:MAG: hypothetical protein FWF29_08190, partial [Treponema sp.]|nr:hypothetical protein [Treponema sp.]